MPLCLFSSCQKPLGHASIEEGYNHCHDHRKCSKCSLDCTSIEIDFCLKNNFTITHARCLSLSDKLSINALEIPIEVEIDLLNLCRLLIWPDKGKSQTGNEYDAEVYCDKLIINMDLEEKFLCLRRMQSVAARLSLLLKKDSQAIKKEMEQRESKRFQEAEQQAKTSSRPVSKPATDQYENTLASFMAANGITDRKIGIKKMNDREKAIKSFTNLGLSREMAESTVDKQRSQIQ